MIVTVKRDMVRSRDTIARYHHALLCNMWLCCSYNAYDTSGSFLIIHLMLVTVFAWLPPTLVEGLQFPPLFVCLQTGKLKQFLAFS